MNVTLVASKRTFNLVEKKPVVEWKNKTIDVDDLKMPIDFEIRLVNAAVNGKKLEDEFTELMPSWSSIDNMKQCAKELFSRKEGLTDIAFLVNELGIGVVVDSHNPYAHNKMFEVDSIESLKKVVHNAS